MAAQLHVRALAAGNLAPQNFQFPLPGENREIELDLACVPGASAVLVGFRIDAAAGSLDPSSQWLSGEGIWAEVEAHNAESVQLRLRWELGFLDIQCPGRSRPLLFRRPPGYRPPLPLTPAETKELDLVLLIDGTTMAASDHGLEPLIGQNGRWSKLADGLADLASGLSEHYSVLKTAVVAFGDKQPEGYGSLSLRPEYLLHNPKPSLVLDPIDMVRRTLKQLHYSPGADFVDALAYALHRCRSLNWRPNSRKILVLLGDSPGHSLFYPPAGFREIDALVRKCDVDWEAEQLHQEGVEIVTIYYNPENIKAYEHPASERIIRYVQAQYERIASRRSFCLLAGEFTAADLSRRIREDRGVIARGPCLGVLKSPRAENPA
jgi:hypothetical protein